MRPLARDDPDRIGSYVLLRLLGAGGMGRVYLASSPGGRLTAVKVVRAELAEDPAFRARFRREVRACQAVSGAFTTSVVDADPEAATPWLATTYVPGPSLHEAVAGHGPLDEGTGRALAAGLAEALVAIHQAGLVHRDLKPANVLLAEDGPRVIDFGISRAMDGTTLTGTGVVMGSAGYMAPEQVASTRDVGPAGDVFAFGATLVFALTGEGPFGSGPPAGTLYRVVNGAPRLDGVPAVLLPLVTACLAKDPARRPTPADLVRALGGGGKAWPPVVLQDEFQRRTREAAALAALPRPDALPPGPRVDPVTPIRSLGRRRVLGLTAGIVGGLAGAAATGGVVAWATGDSGTASPKEIGHSGQTGQGGTAPRASNAAHGLGAPGGPLPLWTFAVPGLATHPTMLTIGDLLVVVTHSDGVYGVDTKTGTRRWFLPPRTRWGSSEVTSSPVHFFAGHGQLYCTLDVGGRYGTALWIVDQRSGRLRPVGIIAPRTEAIGPIMAMSGSVVLFHLTETAPPGDHYVAYDVRAKRRLWKRPLGRSTSTFSAVADEFGFYFVQGELLAEKLVAVDVRSGKDRWTAPLGTTPGTQLLANVAGTVVATSPNPTTPGLTGYSATDGARRWQVPTTYPAQVGVNATGIYVVGKGFPLRALDPGTGAARWTAKGIEDAYAEGGYVLVGASDTLVAASFGSPRSSSVRIFDPAGGSSPWTYTLPAVPTAPMNFAVAGDIVCLLNGTSTGISGFAR
ncbi:protein kinase domain-containing protein [Actinomadura oligospora]|uniref:serine/threonine-protein kinase n=1 Tax=Actinomadura oligospora TaxID=111804 RepID=UPI0004AE2760|nr:serine/threonine-protein kinase [Actinomadura oligospora]